MSNSFDASMVIARAPLRISFAGGGTDLPAYYERHGGLVLNAAINRAVCAVVSPGDEESVHIGFSSHHRMDGKRLDPGDYDAHLALPRAIARAMELQCGASIFITSEVPPGSGLGSSSATAIALIAAIAAFQRDTPTPAQLAERAAELEMVRLGQPIGKQDQYASAYGGVNVFAFGTEGVTRTPVPLSLRAHKDLEAHLALYFTGRTRQAGAILREQQARTARGEARTVESLHAIKQQVAPMRAALEAGDYAMMGALLDEAWRLKRQVSRGISTSAIDQAYATARSAGALGGKITGAGGGGFLLLLVPPPAQERVRAALAPLGLQRMSFALEPRGAHTFLAEQQWPALVSVPGNGATPDAAPDVSVSTVHDGA